MSSPKYRGPAPASPNRIFALLRKFAVVLYAPSPSLWSEFHGPVADPMQSSFGRLAD
jgi:hypothetical protein